MFKDVLQLTSEKVPEFPLLFKGHLSYIRHDIANKRGKYSTDIRQAFFSTSRIKKTHKHMTDTEKDEFIRNCKELRELQMEIEGGKIIYNWETGGEAFNSELLVVVLGLTFAGSGFNIKETNKTKPVSVTLDQLAFTFYTIQRIIALSENVNLSKEFQENT